MSDRRHYEPSDEPTTTLSLAVRLVDVYTGGQPTGTPRVRIDGVDATPVKTRSGYHVFLDLVPDTVTVAVDGGEQYLDTRRNDVPLYDPTDPDTDLDPSDPETLPVVELPLKPSPAYQFQAGATRLRGRVLGPNGDPVDGAEVTLRVRDRSARGTNGSAGNDRTATDTEDSSLIERSTLTTASGEFVLCLGVADSPAVADATSKLEGPDGEPTVEVVDATFGRLSTTVPVEEGALTVENFRYP